MKLELNLKYLLDAIEGDYDVNGAMDVTVTGFANLQDAMEGDLSFVQSKKYANQASETRASVLLVPANENFTLPDNPSFTAVAVAEPSRALSQICGRVASLLYPKTEPVIHQTAIVDEDAIVDEASAVGAYTTIGSGTRLEADVVVGARVSLGNHCHIAKGVKIADNVVIGDYTSIGEGSIIHSGVVIGTAGFGYDFNPNTGCHDPIPQIGSVQIGRYVEIGANTTVDRARIGKTVIGDGTKIDNLVQIAHNVKIGRHCILCAQVGISGTVNIGDYVVLAGKVGVADHVDIAPGIQIGGGSAVMSSLSTPKAKLLGQPAMDFGLAMKIIALQRRLPDLFKRVGAVEKALKSDG